MWQWHYIESLVHRLSLTSVQSNEMWLIQEPQYEIFRATAKFGFERIFFFSGNYDVILTS